MSRAGRAKLQHWTKWVKKLAGSRNFHITKSARRHWKAIAIVLILIATVLPSLASAKPLRLDVSLSTGERWAGYCCGSLAYRTNFYGWDTSKALASLLIVTNSTWLSHNEIYVYLWHQPKLDIVTLYFQASTSLGEVAWKNGGITLVWDPSMGETPRILLSEDTKTGTLTFQKVAHPEASLALLIESSSGNEIILTVEFAMTGAWIFGAQHYQGRVSDSVKPNQIGMMT